MYYNDPVHNNQAYESGYDAGQAIASHCKRWTIKEDLDIDEIISIYSQRIEKIACPYGHPVNRDFFVMGTFDGFTDRFRGYN